MEPKTNLKPLVLKTDLGDSFFDYEEVIRFEADGHYTIVHLVRDKQVRCTLSIKDLTPILPQKIYFRCHRSHIVNLSYITNYNGKTSMLTVAENEIPLSASYENDFLNLFG